MAGTKPKTLLEVKAVLGLAFAAAAEKLGAKVSGAPLEKPPQAGWGDLGTSLALSLAKTLKKSPRAIGEALAAEFKAPEGWVEKIEVAGPGYVNVHLQAGLWRSLLSQALAQSDDFGSGASPRTSESRVDWNIEFVSANPTGPLNVVNGRSAAVGDLIASLLARQGKRVQREYYFNDSGKQASLFGLSLIAAARRLKGETAPAPEGGYGAPYVEDLASELGLSPGDDPAAAGASGMKRVKQWQEASLARYGLAFDLWTSEQSIHDRGKVAEVLESMKKSGKTFEDGGALYLRTSEFGDPRDRVIQRSDEAKRVTYLVPDLAYQLEKMDRADSTITLLGPDHQGQIPSLEAGLKILAPKGETEHRAYFLVVQQVNLIKDGKPHKMGKRLGMFVTLDELLEEVGVDAARWFFSSRTMDTPLDFDLDLAKLKTDENPVYYVQYGHARIASLFREAENRVQGALDSSSLALELSSRGGRELMSPEEKNLMELVLNFPEIIQDCAQPLAFPVHRLPGYLLDLARGFHGLYGAHRILGSGEDERPRLALAAAARQVLASGLALMKVSAPDRM